MCFYGNQKGSYESKDNAVQTAPSALAEDPTSGSQSDPFILKPVPDVYAERRRGHHLRVPGRQISRNTREAVRSQGKLLWWARLNRQRLGF